MVAKIDSLARIYFFCLWEWRLSYNFFSIFALHIVWGCFIYTTSLDNRIDDMKNFFALVWEFAKRNPILTLFIVMFPIVAPQLLGIFALVLIIPLAILIIGALAIAWRVRKVRRDMESQFRDADNRGAFRQRAGADTQGAEPEGKVTVHIPHQEPRVNDEVGEYVPFKEE